MPRVLKRPQANLDLYEIWEYVARAHEERARKLMDSLEAHFERLAEYPNMGRARPELGRDLRSFPVGRYVVFYRPLTGEEQGIEIARVVRAERDVDDLF